MTAVRQRKGSKGKEPGPSIQNLKPESITEPREWFATGQCCLLQKYISTFNSTQK